MHETGCSGLVHWDDPEGWDNSIFFPRPCLQIAAILEGLNNVYAEGLMLKLQYFCHLMGRADSLEKTLILGKKRQEEKRTTEDEMVGWRH